MSNADAAAADGSGPDAHFPTRESLPHTLKEVVKRKNRKICADR